MKINAKILLISSVLTASTAVFATDAVPPVAAPENVTANNPNQESPPSSTPLSDTTSTFSVQPLELPEDEARIRAKEETCIDVEEEVAMLNQLQEFELGQFLLKNKVLDAKWTSYVMKGQKQNNVKNELEDWMLHKAPAVKATQERYEIFQQQLHKYLRINSKVASVPCGSMDVLLELNLDGIHDIKMVGLDIDPGALAIAKANYVPNKNNSIELLQGDAWQMHLKPEYDVLVSNGLNIYEKDEAKLSELYKKFHDSLKDGGVLITSFLTPPPELDKRSTWHNYDKKDTLKQKALFGDVIEVKWQSFRTEDDTRHLLENAGFKVVEVIYDSQGMFPTVVARK
jgi:SAM-dependent methyltransferase